MILSRGEDIILMRLRDEDRCQVPMPEQVIVCSFRLLAVPPLSARSSAVTILSRSDCPLLLSPSS